MKHASLPFILLAQFEPTILLGLLGEARLTAGQMSFLILHALADASVPYFSLHGLMNHNATLFDRTQVHGPFID